MTYDVEFDVMIVATSSGIRRYELYEQTSEDDPGATGWAWSSWVLPHTGSFTYGTVFDTKLNPSNKRVAWSEAVQGRVRLLDSDSAIALVSFGDGGNAWTDGSVGGTISFKRPTGLAWKSSTVLLVVDVDLPAKTAVIRSINVGANPMTVSTVGSPFALQSTTTGDVYCAYHAASGTLFLTDATSIMAVSGV